MLPDIRGNAINVPGRLTCVQARFLQTQKITMKVAPRGEVVLSFATNKSFIQANVNPEAWVT